MIALLLFAQLASCKADALDLRAARAACAADETTRVYLDGFIAAVDAYKQGGSPESLTPVAQAIARLEAIGGTMPGQAQIAVLVLRAASAAAQSERDEMGLLLDHALQLETLQLVAKQPGAPVVTAHEAAGDFWLQVHVYERARAAYRLAGERVGVTPRVQLGLARVAARMKDAAAACEGYRAFLDRWGRTAPAASSAARPSPLANAAPPGEVIEARTFVQQRQCANTSTGAK